MNTQGKFNEPVRIIKMPTVHTQSTRQLLGIAVLAIVFAIGPGSARANVYDWAGTSSVNMSGTPANWGGTVPTATDVARWNAASYINMPTANANMTIGELLFDTGNTAGVTFGAVANTLTLKGISNFGIQLNSGSGAVGTGSAKFALGASQTWANNSGSTLTVGGTVNLSVYTLTIDGSGPTTLGGVISGGGGLVKTGSGTLTFSSANTYTGASTINNGTVTLGINAGLGPVATTVLNMTGGTLNLGTYTQTLLALSGNGSSDISSSGAATLTLTPIANSTSSFAGTIGTGGTALAVTISGAGAVTLSGNNPYTGITTLTAGQLNINNNGALGTSALATALTLTTGIIDNTSGGDVTLTANTPVTLSGNFSFGGLGNLSFGSGTLLTTASRTLSLMGSGGKTLTFGTWNNNFATSTTTVNAMPGSTSSLRIGTFISTSTASVGTMAGTGNITITGGIQPGAAGGSIVYSGTGTLTLKGGSTYTGATTFNSGTVILDATGGAATLQATAPTFAGGTFIFKGDGSGTGQTLGNVTLNAGASSIQVVGGGASGTTLTLGTMTDANNNSMMNINLSGTTPVVTSSTAVSANGIFGTRAAITLTTGGTTEFAGKSGTSIVQYTGQSDFLGSGSLSSVNYKGADNLAVTASETMNTLRLTTTTTGQSLDLGANTLTLASGGLLFVGAHDYEVKGTGTPGLKSSTAATGDLIVHNFGSGVLTISAVIGNNTGISVLSLDGTGTNKLSGVNTYTGVTLAGGGAVLSIGANSGLGAVATGAGLTLNNATLQATGTFALDDGAGHNRVITLGTGGGTIDVTGANTLTVLGAMAGGQSSLTKIGTGTLLLTGVNTYGNTAGFTGFTRIQNGTLQIGGAAGAINANNIVVLGDSTANTAGILVLGDNSNTKSQTIAGLLNVGSGASAVVAGGNAANSTLTFTGSLLTPSTFAGTLGGAGSNQDKLVLNVTAGQLTLSGNNTYTGGTTLQTAAGVLNINSTTAIGAGTLALNFATAVIDNTSGSTKIMSNNNNVTTTTGFVFAGSNDLNFGSGSLSTTIAATPIPVWGNKTLTFGGGLVNNVAAGAALTLTVNGSTGTLSLGGFNMQNISGGVITDTINGSGNVNITGPITPGAFHADNALTYNGTGVLTLSGANTYTGLTTINNAAGMLKFAPGARLNGGAGNLTLTAGVVDLGGRRLTEKTLTATAGRITSSSPGGSLTSTGIATANGADFDGTLSVNLTMASGAAASALSGSFANTGDITLNNNSASTLTVSSASLNPSGSITNSGSGTGAVTISGVIGPAVTSVIKSSANSTLTLTGATTYTGPTIVSAGTLALSGSASIANMANVSVASGATLSFASGALLTFQANGTAGTVDKLNVTGNLTLNANAITVNVTGSALAPGTYQLMHCTGTLSNTGVFGVPTITGTPLGEGYVATIVTTAGSGGRIDLVIAYSLFWGGSYDGFDTLSVRSQGIPQPILTVLGTNGVALVDGDAESDTKGTAFGTCATNAAVTNWFVVTNSGVADLSISTPVMTGDGTAHFSLGGMPSNLLAGAVSNFWITFAPSSVDLQTALVSIANSSTTTPFRINISGTGTGDTLSPGKIELSPTSLDFTATYLGAAPSIQVFSVKNKGQSPFGYTNTLAYAAGASGWLSVNSSTGYVTAGASQIHTGQVSIGVLMPGTYTVTNTVSSPDADNSPQSLVVTLTVAKATPSITWANPETITYGTALGLTQLNASPSVAGSLTYTPPAGTLLNPGTNQVLQVVLNPDDSSRYDTATSQVAISVNPVIVAAAGMSGTIVPNGTVVVPFGGSTNFVVTVSDSRYQICSVLSNGVAVDAAIRLQVFTSQWHNVTGVGSITAVFDENRFVGGDYDGYGQSSGFNQRVFIGIGSIYSIR